MLVHLLMALAIEGQADVGSLPDLLVGQRTSGLTFVRATVEPVCSVDISSADTVIDLATREQQTVSTVTYTCNALSGFTRRISSANSGSLRRGDQGIDYFLSQTGDGSLAISRVQLTSPVVDSVSASSTLVEGASGSLQVDVPVLAGDLFAGEYQDTVSIEITPN